MLRRRECQSTPLKDQAFSTFLSQNPPFELPPENGVSLRQKPQCGVPRLVSQSMRLEAFRLLIEHEPNGTAAGELARLLSVPHPVRRISTYWREPIW